MEYREELELMFGSVPVERAFNAHILEWWGSENDEVISRTIHSHAWLYPFIVTEQIVNAAPALVINDWRSKDPLCARYDWRNILMFFAIARAQQVGLTETIQKPRKKTCLLCGAVFYDDSIPYKFYRKFCLINELDYCRECCGLTFEPSDLIGDRYSRADIETFAIDMSSLIQSVPQSNFFAKDRCMADWDSDTRTSLMRMGAKRPTPRHVKNSHGSWLQVLVSSGILPDGSQKMARGVRSLAADGHVCHSIAEKTIDDWLSANEIPHEREPQYPSSRMRADFLVGDVLIEFFGLVGNEVYDKKIVLKRSIAEEHGLTLLEIYPRDLVSWIATQKRISAALNFQLKWTGGAHPMALRPVEPKMLEPHDAHPTESMTDNREARGLNYADRSIEAGWYADPTGRFSKRLWTGESWSTDVRSKDGSERSDTPYVNDDKPPVDGIFVDGREAYEWFHEVEKLAKTDLELAMGWWYRLMDATENESRKTGGGVAPASYDRLSKRFQKSGDRTAELAVLERFARQKHSVGSLPPKLMKRRDDLRNSGYRSDTSAALMIAEYSAPEAGRTRE